MKPKTWLIAALLIASITFAALSHKIWQLRRELVSMEWQYEILAMELNMFKQDIARYSLKKAGYRILGDGKCEMWIPCNQVKTEQ